MRTRMAALTAACTLTLTLAACGNDPSTSSDPTVASSATTSASSSATGASGTQSSAASSSGTSSSGASNSASGASSAGSTSSTSAPSTPSATPSGTQAPTATADTTAHPSQPAPSRTTAQGTSHGNGSTSGGKASGQPTAGAGGHTYVASGWSQFASPSGKNFCNAQGEVVGCIIPASESAKHGGANYVTLTPRGVGFLTGDPGMDTDGETRTWATSIPGAPAPVKNGSATLPYGSSIRYQGVTCASTVNGFTCRNAVASFTVNAQSLTISGKRA